MQLSYLRFSNHLRKRLKYWREAKGLSKTELAELVGIKLQVYQRLEGGKGRANLDRETVNPELRTLYRIAVALEVDVLELLPSIFEDVEEERLAKLNK